MVEAQLLPPERARLARRALDALEAAGPGEHLELALDLAETADDRLRAARCALELGRRALARGAPATAEAILLRARGHGHLSLDVGEALARTWAYQGRVEEAWAAGRRVLEQLDPSDAERAARLRLVLARASLAAGCPAEAAELVERAREAASGEVVHQASALGAQAAIALGDLEGARTLAGRVVEADAPPEVLCEALEVIGRIERNRDVSAAEAAFERARQVAERNGLELWRARALHELGTIDLMSRPRYDRLLAAREAAEATGAVSILALVDLHLGAVALALWDTAIAQDAFRRCVEMSGRMRLSTLGMGLVHLAAAHAMAGDADAMEDAIARALQADPDAVDVHAGVHGRARAFLALRRADWATACDHLDRAIAILDTDPSLAFPFRGIWTLLRAALGRDGEEAIAHAMSAAGWGNVLNQAATAQAGAVEAGRAGRAREALEQALQAHAVLQGVVGEPFRALPWRVTAEAALRDGWGEPVSWLLECLAVFEAVGLGELASSCRALLREAGAKVPRRGRGDSDVSPELRRLGVTSREMDVLQLVAQGLTNREAAARLHLSPKTVENHVSSLLVKTGAADRTALAAWVAVNR